MRTDQFDLYYGDRPDVDDYVFLFLGSVSTNQRTSVQQASLAHSAGVAIYTIATTVASESEVAELSSPPHQRDYNYFIMQSYNQLDSTVDTMLSYATEPNVPQSIPPVGK